MAARRHRWMRVGIVAAVIVGGVPLAALSTAPAAQAADQATTTDVAMPVPVPGTTMPPDTPLLSGPGGQPWWVDGSALKTVVHGALVTHALPAGIEWRRVATATGVDHSLWLESSVPAVVARVTPDGSFATFPIQGGADSGIVAADDGAAWVIQFHPVGWAAVRIAPDGTQTRFEHTGDAPMIDQYTPSAAGPAGSAWAMFLYHGMIGMFPDGHTVTVDTPENAHAFQADGVEYFNFTTASGDTIERVNADGSATTIATNAAHLAQTGGQGFYATPVDARHTMLHRLGMPSWHPIFAEPVDSVYPSLWLPGTHTILVAQPDSSPAQLGVYAVSEDGHITRFADGDGIDLEQDGTLWGKGGGRQYRMDGSIASERAIVTDPRGYVGGWGVSADGPWEQITARPSGVTTIDTLSPATVTRLAGDDRYETAVAVAKRAFPSHTSVVYLAAGTNFPDALAAGPAAAAEHAALLLTTPGGLPTATAAELKALAPTRVVIAGGTSSVGSAVERSVRALLPAATVQRRSGATRYETANTLVGAVFHSANTVYIASGAAFPDALGAGAAAGSGGDPLLLVDPASPGVSESTAAAITRLHPARIVVVGGRSAVPDAVLAALGKLAPATRVAGADRFSTSVALATSAFPHATSAFIASGLDFPDAMSGAVLAAANHAPVYAFTAGCVPHALARGFAAGVNSITIVGGPAVIDGRLDTLGICSDE